MYYIYDINNLRIPYFLDHRPAMFEEKSKAMRMCEIMNSVIKDKTFIVTCSRGLYIGSKVRVSDSAGSYDCVITEVQLDETSPVLLYKVEYEGEGGGYDWLYDFEIEVRWGEE